MASNEKGVLLFGEGCNEVYFKNETDNADGSNIKIINGGKKMKKISLVIMFIATFIGVCLWQKDLFKKGQILAVDIINWKTYKTTEDGWKTGLDVSLKYPSDWNSRADAGGTWVNSIIADYSLSGLVSEDGLCVYDQKITPMPQTEECKNARIFHSVVPDKYCRISLYYNGSKSESGLNVGLENTYTDNLKKTNCNNILEQIKKSLVSEIIPVFYK